MRGLQASDIGSIRYFVGMYWSPWYRTRTVSDYIADMPWQTNCGAKRIVMSEYPALSFRVPAPEIRPGDSPDFSDVVIPKAGSVRRPPVDSDPEKIRDLAFTIIRVMTRDGHAAGDWAGMLGEDELRSGLRHMMRLRAFDARMLMAQRQGKTSFYMQHLGEEAIACAFQRALSKGDMNFPTYRQAGLLLSLIHISEPTRPY